MKMMKSAIINQWKRIDLMDVPVPTPEQDEALVRIIYCGICGSDIHLYNGVHPTAKPPVPLGHEMVGVVEEINTKLPVPFRVGDRVSIHGASCGKCDLCLGGAANQCRKRGVKPQLTSGDSEYMVSHVDYVVPIPECLTNKAASLLEPFACAIRTTDRARIRTGDTILVIGGGAIGFAAALTAREMGASRVIMSVKHQNRIDLARHYGFEVVDPASQDVVQTVLDMTNGEGVNATIETSCTPSGIGITPAVTAVEGTIVMLAVGLEPKPVFDVGMIALKELNIVGSRAHTVADMRRAARLMGVLCKKYDLDLMISDVIPLDQIEEGFRMMIEHKNKGKILVKMESHSKT